MSENIFRPDIFWFFGVKTTLKDLCVFLFFFLYTLKTIVDIKTLCYCVCLCDITKYNEKVMNTSTLIKQRLEIQIYCSQ